ncbi:MAG: VWA domain-containing protein [Burkholderiaceae bacterium]
MTFVWPQMLWALLAVPLLGTAYLLWVRRRRAARNGYAGLVAGSGPGGGWLRHLPPVLFLMAIVLLLVSVGRPAAVVTLPAQHEVVVLAIDVSGSMRATDVKPNRLAAAQAAARAFIEQQPRSTRIGIVSFAGVASLVQPPTEDREDLYQAIERMQPQRGTAIGSAIVVSLATVFPGAGIDLRMVGRRDGAPGADGNREQRRDAARSGAGPNAAAKPFEPVPAGSYDAAVIVLLTDGQSTTGPDPIAAARLAADRGVRVYTVGVGTPKGEVLRTDGWSMRVALDEAQLKTIADLTRGEHFLADSAEELKRIYQSMNSRFVMEKKELEVGALFAAAAALLALIAAGLSVAWYGRVL